MVTYRDEEDRAFTSLGMYRYKYKIMNEARAVAERYWNDFGFHPTQPKDKVRDAELRAQHKWQFGEWIVAFLDNQEPKLAETMKLHPENTKALANMLIEHEIIRSQSRLAIERSKALKAAALANVQPPTVDQAVADLSLQSKEENVQESQPNDMAVDNTSVNIEEDAKMDWAEQGEETVVDNAQAGVMLHTNIHPAYETEHVASDVVPVEDNRDATFTTAKEPEAMLLDGTRDNDKHDTPNAPADDSKDEADEHTSDEQTPETDTPKKKNTKRKELSDQQLFKRAIHNLRRAKGWANDAEKRREVLTEQLKRYNEEVENMKVNI